MDSTVNESADARCVAFFASQLKDEPTWAALARAAGFTAEVGTTLLVAGIVPRLLVGCGDRLTLTESTLREAFGAAGRQLAHLRHVEVDLTAIGSDVLAADLRDAAAVLGLSLGAYRFDRHQRQRTPRPAWTPISRSPQWDDAADVAIAINAVRDVVNEPGNLMTPDSLAQHVVEIGESGGLRVLVRDEDWLAREGAGGILAIGGGSFQRPKMLEIIHEGDGEDVDLCLVGKGVTFDSGGLSMKDPTAIMLMQMDMAAVPTIAYAMTFLAQVAPSLHVRAFCPLVENMPGPQSARPGDIVTARNGTTIEILNTDFEGRVILADGLAFASEHKPKHLVDLATLTYGAPNALGPRTAALFGHGAAMELVTGAADASGEQVWRLPMPEYMLPTIRSRVADVKNYPYEAKARASTAAMFLREFVPPGASWAHIDIAGPGWTDEVYAFNPIGATGFGMRLLLELFRLIDTSSTEHSADERWSR